MLHRTRTWAHLALTLIVVLLTTSVVFAQEATPEPVGLRPDAPTYALHGPYWVGTMEFTIPDKDGKRPLPVTVWYPALNPKGTPEKTTLMNQGLPFFGQALPDADPDLTGGPYPLVVYSHGNYSTRLTSLFYTEHLASYGFVVIAPDHTGNIFMNFGENYFPFFVYRPQDITRVIDYAETGLGGALPSVIDTDHIAVTGHSFGGMTVFLTSGIQLDLATFDDVYCNQVRAGKITDAVNICGLMDFKSQLAQLEGLKAVPEGLWPSLGDSRVDAAVAFAPGGGEAVMRIIGNESYQNLKIPMLLMGGSHDTQAVPEFNSYWAYDHIGSPQKALVVLDGADHSIFMNACEATPWIVTEWKYYVGCSDAVWDMDRAHDLINHFTTAFLLDVLKGDKEAHKALAPDAVKFVGIEYQAQGF